MAARSATEKAPKAKTAQTTKVNRTTVGKNKKQISSRLAQIRGARSQRSFAKELGVFQQNVNRYENGTTPHADFLITLALKENVSIDWLLLGKGAPRRRG